MSVDAVLFDLDGTLLDRRATFRRHIELQIARHPQIFGHGDPAEHVAVLLELDRNGMLDRGAFFEQAELRCALPAGAAAALREDFEAHFPESCVPFPELAEALTGLRSAGLKLGLVTNGRGVIQNRKVEGLGLRSLLDCVVISDEVGLRKPDSRIFALALERLGVAPARAVFVGDNPEADIAGAKAAGLLACWRRDDFWPQPGHADIIIDSLDQLAPAMESRRNHLE